MRGSFKGEAHAVMVRAYLCVGLLVAAACGGDEASPRRTASSRPVTEVVDGDDSVNLNEE